MHDRKKIWRQRVKEYLLLAFGGKCAVCGYDRSVSAIDYHHLNSNDKENGLANLMRDGAKWSDIVEEARRCTILCCRCHRELHAGVIKLPEIVPLFNEEYADVMKLKKKEYDLCPVCGNDKPKSYKFCCHKCSTISQRKFNPSKEELEKLTDEMPITKVAKLFNVCDISVRKRCEILGINLKKYPRGYWLKTPH